jgi:hypothetical protein
MLKFHATGNWAKCQLGARTVPSTRQILPQVERLIDQAWQEAGSRPGVKLFDGPMCRLERWRASADRLEIDLSATSYKPFVGTNLAHPELAEQYGGNVMANPVGVSPALLTSDGFLMMGRRNASVAYYPNRIHPFAGALEPRDGNDLVQAVHRELAEELSLREEDLLEIRCTGIAEDTAMRQPELIFSAAMRLNRRQIEAQLHAEEHGGSVAIPTDPVAVAGAAHDPALTPVATASLLLWGRIALGEEWFATNSQTSRV